MFTKSKISQSMLDAVNSVIAEEDKKLLLEPEKKSTKIATPTGTKVLGHRYGNSAKAHKDQTSHDVDKLKGPKAKEMKEEDGSCVTEPEAKNIAKKEVKGHEKKMHKEEFSFQQKLVERAKMKMKENKGNGPQETFTDNNMGEEKHVETMHKSPSKGTDIADKSYLKDMGKKPTVKGDLKNLGRFLTGKKETNESVEVTSGKSDEVTTDMIKGREKGGNSNEFKPYKLQLKIDGEMKAPAVKEPEETAARKSIETHHSTESSKREKLSSTIKKMHEEEAILDEMINEVLAKDASAGDYIDDFVHSDNPKFAGKSKKKRKEMALAAYYSKKNEEVGLSEGVEVKKEYDDKKEAEHGVYHKGKKIGYIVHDKKHDTHTAYHSPSSHDDDGHADDYSQIDDFHKHHHAVAQIKASAGVNEEVGLDEADTKNTDLEHRQDMRRKEGMTLHLQQMGKNPKQIEKLMKKMKMPHSEETVVEGRMKDMATNKAEDERLEKEKGSWKKETPWMDSKETVTDKSGAKHTPMSRAKDLARSAFKKLQKETMMGKISN